MFNDERCEAECRSLEYHYHMILMVDDDHCGCTDSILMGGGCSCTE